MTKSQRNKRSKSCWYLDIPTKACVGNPDAGWDNIEIFNSKKQAVKFIRDNFGSCDEDGNVCLLTEGSL